MSRFFLLLLLSWPLTSSAELYQWTDDQGRAHFGDRPPVNIEAKTLDVKIQNSDFELLSDKARQSFERIQKNQHLSDTKRQQQAQQQALAIQQRCQQARQTLHQLQGPVVFIDKEGNSVAISENERAARASRLETTITRYCH